METVLVEKKNIDDVVDLLMQDEVVAFPTETVFGLGVRFSKLSALEKIYEIKNRDHNKAVTLMIRNKEDIEKYAYVNDDAKKIIANFMPGMITLVLKKKSILSDDFTANLDTIGIRIPDDPFVLSLLEKVGPMLVTSANISGQEALLNDHDVYQEFKGKLKMIVKGKCKQTLASTVIKVDKDVTILRQGCISEERIKKVLKMKIAMACDHGGLRLKNVLKEDLEKNGYEVVDFGTYTEDSCDYPDYASKAAKAVADKTCDKGVVVCGTGIGVSITANKVDGIRCALCHDVFSAKATRQHNDSNMLAMGQRVIGEGLALEIMHAWLESEYEGGRHDARIAKMMALEKE